ETHRANEQGPWKIGARKNRGKPILAGRARRSGVSFSCIFATNWLGEELRFGQAKLAAELLSTHRLACSDQPLWGFRQQEPRERQQEDNRGCANQEKSAPADDVLKCECSQRCHDTAGGDTGVGNGVEEVAAPSRGKFGDDSATGCDDDAHS